MEKDSLQKLVPNQPLSIFLYEIPNGKKKKKIEMVRCRKILSNHFNLTVYDNVNITSCYPALHYTKSQAWGT